MTVQNLKSQVFKLKGRLYTLTVLQLMSTDHRLFDTQLHEITTQAPLMFSSTPIVLDCSQLGDAELDLARFCKCLRAHSLIPVAVQGGTQFINTLAIAQGMAVLNASSNLDKAIANKAPATVEVPVPVETLHSTRMITVPVRSGQQIVSKEGDLVICGPVSPGAEVLADGNIHIYGPLRGRALAGISGNKNARIFCQLLEAELVSIAGYYRLSEALEFHAGPCQIYLKDDHICIEAIN